MDGDVWFRSFAPEESTMLVAIGARWSKESNHYTFGRNRVQPVVKIYSQHFFRVFQNTTLIVNYSNGKVLVKILYFQR